MAASDSRLFSLTTRCRLPRRRSGSLPAVAGVKFSLLKVFKALVGEELFLNNFHSLNLWIVGNPTMTSWSKSFNIDARKVTRFLFGNLLDLNLKLILISLDMGLQSLPEYEHTWPVRSLTSVAPFATMASAISSVT